MDTYVSSNITYFGLFYDGRSDTTANTDLLVDIL